MRLVAEAQASKSSAQLLADRAAALLFYVALAAAIVTLVAWLLLKPDDPTFVLERVVSVLVIACPHALGLAIPLVSQISTALGARSGILVRKRIALEDARRVDVVLFDKTGTLTRGEQGVVAVHAVDGDEDDAARTRRGRRGASPSTRSRARSSRRRRSADSRWRRSSGFDSHAGRGATASVGGRAVSVGSAGLVAERGLEVPGALAAASTELGAGGATVVYVLDDTAVLGIIALADVLRPESAEAVAELRRRGVRVAMLTGDSNAVGDWVAAQLGIDEVHAEVLPGGKADVVRELQARRSPRRDGRRRRQRRSRAHPGRRRHRDRRRHGCRDRVRRHRARVIRSAVGGGRAHPQPRHVAQGAAEPVLGHRLQRGRHPARRRRARSARACCCRPRSPRCSCRCRRSSSPRTRSCCG